MGDGVRTRRTRKIAGCGFISLAVLAETLNLVQSALEQATSEYFLSRLVGVLFAGLLMGAVPVICAVLVLAGMGWPRWVLAVIAAIAVILPIVSWLAGGAPSIFTIVLAVGLAAGTLLIWKPIPRNQRG